MSDGDELLSIKQVTELLGVSIDTVRRRIKNGLLKAELIDGPHGKYYGIRASEIKVAKEVKDVVIVNRNITPEELINRINKEVEIRLAEREFVMMERIDELDAKLNLILEKISTPQADNVEAPPKQSIWERLGLRRKK
jgi:DNA-binding transcriptional MerR regulator